MKIEATGKSVEIAIQNGLLECGMSRDDVQIKVIDEGSLFKKAKVILSWGEDVKAEVVEEQTEHSLTEEQPSETIENNQPEEKAKVEKPKRIFDSSRLQEKGIEFLTGLAKKFDDKAQVTATAKDNELTFSVTGDNLGKMIGFRGETLQALQILMSGLKAKNEGGIRIYLDVDNYKTNKNQNIIDMANKMADQAVKIERNVHMDPLNAYERRIVHTTLQERDDVTTESTGEGEKRHVVIKPKR